MDGKNHNWVFMDYALFMPFSYMSFVIKHNIEEDKIDSKNNMNIFDQEAFNYIFFKGTSFIDGKFVYNNNKLLTWVLKNAQKFSPDLTDLLNYRQELFSKIKIKSSE